MTCKTWCGFEISMREAPTDNYFLCACGPRWTVVCVWLTRTVAVAPATSSAVNRSTTYVTNNSLVFSTERAGNDEWTPSSYWCDADSIFGPAAIYGSRRLLRYWKYWPRKNANASAFRNVTKWCVNGLTVQRNSFNLETSLCFKFQGISSLKVPFDVHSLCNAYISLTTSKVAKKINL